MININFKLLVILIISSFNCHAQYAQGGAIFIKSIPPAFTNYSITAHLAINWPITIYKPYLKINWGDGNPIDSIPYLGSNCTLYGSTTLIYSGTHTFTPNQTFSLTVLDCEYVAGINNIPNSNSKKLQLLSVLKTNYYNSNPKLTSICLADSVPAGNTTGYNLGLYDSDGDSLSYSIVAPNNISNYQSPPANVNPITSAITFTESSTQPIALTLKVDEWRKISNINTLIASVYMNMFFKTYTPTGIVNETFNDNNFSIYPNPFNNKFTLNINSNKAYNVTITNTFGQLIISKQINQQTTEINLSNYPNGIYFVNISVEDKRKVFKLVKE